MKHRPLLAPAMLIASALAVLCALAAHSAMPPPIPAVTSPVKLQSPKAASSPDTLNKAMLVALPVIITNSGSVSASFEPTKIQGIMAGFKYCTNPTNGYWKVLGMMPYPTNGGTVSMNYLGTNIPAIYFKAFWQFTAPPPSAY